MGNKTAAFAAGFFALAVPALAAEPIRTGVISEGQAVVHRPCGAAGRRGNQRQGRRRWPQDRDRRVRRSFLKALRSISVLLGEQNVTFALPHAARVYGCIGGVSTASTGTDGGSGCRTP